MDAKNITVDTKFFEKWDGQDLLKSIRAEDLQGTKDQLQMVLTRMEDKQDGNEKRRKFGRPDDRKSWRDDRIHLYNDLLLVALGAENQERNTWTHELANDVCHLGSSRKKVVWRESFVTVKAIENLKTESIYSYLLDKIHEDEGIMFKYYHAQKSRSKDQHVCLREKALWLVESIKEYRIQLVTPVVTALKDWEDGVNCKALLDKAKKAFKDKVSSYGRNWEERRWRNRARLYWLLAQAEHAPISKGKVGRFKNRQYNGPIHHLVTEMIDEDSEMFSEDEEMLLKHDEDSKTFIEYARVKYDKRKKPIGTFKICRLLAWASATNDHYLVKCVLQHKEKHMESIKGDFEWEESWKKNSWAHALWNASYMGHAVIVNSLLDCDFPYDELYFTYYSNEDMEPPLHVAVRRGHISVVEAFCEKRTYSGSQKPKNFSCHDENADHQTPLEVATTLKVKVAKRKIQSILLQRLEVKQAVEELSLQRELTVNSANAIVVGAVLIAGVAYGGWLQPPLGYHEYYQFTEPPPAPPDTFSSYLSVQGHTTIQVFAICNSLSFFFAIAAVIAGMETTYFIESPEETYIARTVEKLRYKLKGTIGFFIVSVICILIAFTSAGIAILPPIEHQRKSMYITIVVGGFFCMFFIGRMLLFCVSKRLYKGTAKQFRCIFKWLVKRIPVTRSSGGTWKWK